MAMIDVTIIQNDPTSSVDLVGQWLREIPDVRLELWAAYDGQVPVRSRDGLIVLGGRPSVNQEDIYPHLARVKALLWQSVRQHTPVLGICLGMQMLTEVTGGQVAVRSCLGVESGQVFVRWEPSAWDDPVLGPVARQFPDGIWVSADHSDGVKQAPGGAVLLARSQRYLHALRIGNALGVQWHPEAGTDRVLLWAKGRGSDQAGMLADWRSHRAELIQMGRILTHSFIDQIRVHKAGLH